MECTLELSHKRNPFFCCFCQGILGYHGKRSWAKTAPSQLGEDGSDRPEKRGWQEKARWGIWNEIHCRVIVKKKKNQKFSSYLRKTNADEVRSLWNFLFLVVVLVGLEEGMLRQAKVNKNLPHHSWNWCGACTADPPAFFVGKLSGDWINFLEHKPISQSHKFSVNKNEAGSPRLTLSYSFIKWTYITCVLLSTFVITSFWIDKYFLLFPSASVEDLDPSLLEAVEKRGWCLGLFVVVYNLGFLVQLR